MKYKLFVSDFDGTLGIAPDVITPQTVQAIKKYIAQGGKFVICTGRMFSSIKLICEKYGLDGIVISYQGATIDDLTQNKRILEGGIEHNLAAQVAKELLQEGMPACVDVEDVMYCETESEYTDFHKEFDLFSRFDTFCYNGKIKFFRHGYQISYNFQSFTTCCISLKEGTVQFYSLNRKIIK
jgi:HAD superfamily hydrolase (TIGR01484 family)